MDGIQDEQLDFVHSSHCLEHLEDPFEGISNWFRILKPGGHLVITVPEEDLYEQGLFPSTFNADHKWTFTINKGKSWSNKSINVLDLIGSLGHRGEIVKLAKLDLHNTYGLVRFDQTRSPITESCVEFVIRKRDLMELAEGGRLPGRRLPKDSTIPYLNQYKLDQQSLIDANKRITPFKNPIFYEE
jgi:SAM-dependent methyltransferase